MRACFILVGLFFCTRAFPQSNPDPGNVMGCYEGFWGTPQGAQNGRVTIQLRPLGSNQYDGFLTLHRAKAMVAAISLKPSVLANGTLELPGTTSNTSGGDLLPEMQARLKFQNGAVSGTFSGESATGTFEAKRLVRQSPSLGLAPPKGAVVMFDGKDTGKWESMSWEITPEGSMRVTKGDLKAKDRLVNYKLHVEFKIPYMPQARGQARGNSGVYLQSKYEVQVLDSFGIFPLQNNDCGGIYQVAAPVLNACLPPGEWQTFDITYVEGSVASKGAPVITVEHNGIVIIDHKSLPENVVKAGTGGAEANAGFLKLQDHGNPVEYRNIWAEPFYSPSRARGE